MSCGEKERLKPNRKRKTATRHHFRRRMPIVNTPLTTAANRLAVAIARVAKAAKRRQAAWAVDTVGKLVPSPTLSNCYMNMHSISQMFKYTCNSFLNLVNK